MAEERGWKLRLIEEVRRRPALWDCRNVIEKSRERRNKLWIEIGQVLNIKDNICRHTWRSLRSQFRYELRSIRRRVAVAKEKGSYDPNKKYCIWTLFDNLRFLLDGSSLKLTLENNSNIATVTSNNTDEIKLNLVDSGSPQLKTNDDIEIRKSDNLDERAVFKLRLIEEVRKRPLLWDFKDVQRHRKKCGRLWREIGQILDVNVCMCKHTWTRLRAYFRKEVCSIKKRVANSKKAGTYDPHKKYSTWILFDNLRFILDATKLNLVSENSSDIDTVTSNNTDRIKPGMVDSRSLQHETHHDIEIRESDDLDGKTVFKLRLIEEVRKRPLLWDLKDVQSPSESSGILWREIGQILDVNANTCRQAWLKLSGQFRNESCHILEVQKPETYDSTVEYNWRFFDALKFLTNSFSPKATFALNLQENDSVTERVANNNTDRTKLQSLDSNSLPTETDDTKIVNELIADDCFQQHVDKDIFSKKSDSTSLLTAQEDSSFKSYTVALSSCFQGNECETISSHNTVLQIDSVVKEEPELQIKVEPDVLEDEDFNELQEGNSLRAPADKANEKTEHDNIEEFISSPPAEHDVKNVPHSPSEDPIASTHGLNDEYHGLRCSFLSQTKAMTRLQKMEFRVYMQKLLVDTFPASASLEILNKQLLLSDRRFLASFWPFAESLSLMQNSHFRVKMYEILNKISSNEKMLLTNDTKIKSK